MKSNRIFQAFHSFVKKQQKRIDEDKNIENNFIEAFKKYNDKKSGPIIINLLSSQDQSSSQIPIIRQKQEQSYEESFQQSFVTQISQSPYQYQQSSHDSNDKDNESNIQTSLPQRKSNIFNKFINKEKDPVATRKSLRIQNNLDKKIQKQQKSQRMANKQSKVKQKNKNDEEDFFSLQSITVVQAIRKCLVPREDCIKRRKNNKQYEYKIYYKQKGKEKHIWINQTDIMNINPEYLFRYYENFI